MSDKKIVVDFTADFKEYFSKFQQTQRRTEEATNKIQQGFSRVARAAVAMFSVTAVKSFAEAAIQASNKQEIAEKQLATALGFTSKKLLEKASAFQKVTTFGDEQIIEAQSLLAAFVKEEDQIASVTESVLDLAAAKGMDLKAASDLFSKTLGSSTNALSRYGIQVTGEVGSTERLNSVIENVTKAFGGQARALAQTDAGKITQAQNELGDSLERIGKVLSGPYADALSMISTLVNSITTSSGSLSDQFDAQSQKVINLNTQIPKLLTVYDELSTKASLNKDEQIKLKTVIGDIATLMPTAVTQWNNLGEAIDINRTKILDLLAVEKARLAFLNKGMITDIKSQIGDVKKEIKIITGELNSGLSNTLNPFTGEEVNLPLKPEGITNRTNKLKELNAELKGMEAQLKRLNGEDLVVPEPISSVESVEGNGIKAVNTTLESIKNNLLEIKGLVPIPFVGNRPKGPVDPGEKPEVQESQLQPYADYINSGGPFAGENGFVNAVETSMSAAQGFVDGFFTDIRVQGEWANSMLEKAFAGMADAVIGQIQRMAAEWLAMQAIQTAFSFLGLPVASGGGNFVGTDSGVVKMASGGSFVVPQGYPNDSFPMMVQSGERVSVTPANQVSSEGKLMKMLAGRLDALNMNIAGNNNGKQKAIPLFGKLDGQDIYLTNKKNERIYNQLR